VAGLEAARAAAGRGHRVTLVEREERIGGSLHLASAAPTKGEIALLLPYYEGVVQELPVDLRLGTSLTPDLIEKLDPDIVILATGSQPAVPAIEGLESCPHSTYREVLSGSIPAGQRVCVIGGGMVGIDVADLLAGHGREVIIVESGKRLAPDLYPLVAREIEKVIGENERILVYLQTRVARITGNTLICDRSGETVELPCDHLVLATGRVPTADPDFEPSQKAPRLIRVGDCGEPGLIFDAIHDAHNTATKIGVSQAPLQPGGAGKLGGSSLLKDRVAAKIRNRTFDLEDIPEYLELLVSACNAHPKIQKKSRKVDLVFQFEVEEGPNFWIRIERGEFSSGRGPADDSDVIIRMDRRIAPGIFSGQVNAASAYMAKELAFIGPMKHGIAFRTWVNLVTQELGL
jgi:hypothetical protein